MPSQPGQISGKSYALQWVHIDDFTPGGYDGSNISSELPIVSAPLGACNIGATFACAAIQGGALGPLPTIVVTEPVSTIGGIPTGAGYALIAGFITTNQLESDDYEVVTILEADNGTNHFVSATSYCAGVVNVITGPTATTSTIAGYFGAPYPCFTRMTPDGTGNPPPVLVFPTANGASHLWVYPELLSPTSFTAQDIIGSSTTGQVLTYGNRVIVMTGINYDWPAGGGISTNENFNYTDPPQSAEYGDQMTIFTIEEPFGYGGFGTVSVGELLLIKKNGGAVILNGDINVPTSVIRVPGVQSTGNIVGQACATPIGLVYCSQNRGAWVWNGGNTAQKISQNINDDFFDLESGIVESNNYGFNVGQWQKWVMFSGNIMLDTELGGWWQLYPKAGINLGSLTGQNIWWYSITSNGNQIAVSPLTVTTDTDPWLTVFDNTVPSQTYQWTSLPIHVVQNADRVIDIRQIIIRASDPTNSGSATVQCTIGTFDETSSTTIGAYPTPLRFNVGDGAEGLDDIVLTLVANNSSGNSAPIIHSIDIGYQVRAGVAVTN